MLLEISIIW